MKEKRWVVDTNVIVSHLLLPESVSARAMRKASDTGMFLVSDETMDELVRVLNRHKFDRYIDSDKRKDFIVFFGPLAVRVEIVQRIKACRDPKDDKFIEVAMNGGADAVISGDEDLRDAARFLNVRVLSPREFLDFKIEP